MNQLPPEFFELVLHLVSFKTRANVCSVSKNFLYLSLKISKLKSLTPHLYDISLNYYRHKLMDKTIQTKILECGDYHILVKLKVRIDLINVCKFGDSDILALLIKKYSCNTTFVSWDSGLYGASAGGHLDIINLMISKGANDWNGALAEACRTKHNTIVKFMIEKGANLCWFCGWTKKSVYDHE